MHAVYMWKTFIWPTCDFSMYCLVECQTTVAVYCNFSKLCSTYLHVHVVIQSIAVCPFFLLKDSITWFIYNYSIHCIPIWEAICSFINFKQISLPSFLGLGPKEIGWLTGGPNTSTIDEDIQYHVCAIHSVNKSTDIIVECT